MFVFSFNMSLSAAQTQLDVDFGGRRAILPFVVAWLVAVHSEAASQDATVCVSSLSAAAVITKTGLLGSFKPPAGLNPEPTNGFFVFF